MPQLNFWYSLVSKIQQFEKNKMYLEQMLGELFAGILVQESITAHHPQPLSEKNP